MTSDYEVFSDGACRGNPGPGGWGTIVRHGAEEQELSGYDPSTTNNKMELLGAIEGLERVPTGSSVTCTTDSNYVVRGMSNWITGWKRKGWRKADGKPVKNDDLWKRLDALSSERTVSWKWVRGHAGHDENERCDLLANEAIDRRGGL